MLVVVLSAIIAAALAGVAVKYILEYKKSKSRITWREFGIGTAISLLVATLITWAGWSIAKSGKVNFNEYWNGWEVAAVKEYTKCVRDGSCWWTYDCDPYIVMVPYECNCTTSNDGVNRCDTCYRPETRYHSCPYVDTEYHFYVDTTLGRYKIATNVFPENPQAHRWRKSEIIPPSVMRRADIGEPPFWVAVRGRCESNQPGPVTMRRSYVNYILASERTLMKEHSGDMAEYQRDNLLPSLTRNVRDHYHADKVYFVGWAPNDSLAWQKAMEYLNASFGQKEGDLHLVIVKNEKIASNPERYSLALKAHWQNKQLFGIDALSKNAVVILIGTADETTVSWSRAFTGMPLGNEKIIVVMRDGLKGSALKPDVLIGPLISRRNGVSVQYPPDGNYGSIQRILWGVDDSATKFKRVSMSGDDGQGGFLYLKNEIQPSAGQVWAIFVVSFLLSCGVWVWAANHYDPLEETNRPRDY